MLIFINVGSHTLLQVYSKVPRGIQALRMAHLILESVRILSRMYLLRPPFQVSPIFLWIFTSSCLTGIFPFLWLPLLNVGQLLGYEITLLLPSQAGSQASKGVCLIEPRRHSLPGTLSSPEPPPPIRSTQDTSVLWPTAPLALLICFAICLRQTLTGRGRQKDEVEGEKPAASNSYCQSGPDSRTYANTEIVSFTNCTA